MRLPLFALFWLFAYSLQTAQATPCYILPPYVNITAVSFTVQTVSQATQVEHLLKPICELFFFSDNQIQISNPTIAFLTKQQYTALSRWATLHSVPFNVITHDLNHALQSAPTQRTGYVPETTLRTTGIEESFYTSYWSFRDLFYKWSNLTLKYNPHITFEVIGQSLQGRPIYAYRVGNTSEEEPKRVLINGMQHAREWISPHAVTYVLEALASSIASGEGELAQLLETVQVIIVPVVNPDGYEFSRTVDRFARKNRRNAGCQIEALDGVDLNRNWGVDFGGIESTSADPCSNVYFGTAAFSEPETDALRQFAQSLTGVLAHADVHSYSQVILGAWAYTRETPPRAELSVRIGRSIERAMTNVEGMNYTFGSADEVLYLASGVCSDWFTQLGAISYTFELRPRPTPGESGLNGFVLPEDQILGTSKETLAGVTVLIEFAAEGEDSQSVEADERAGDGNGRLAGGIIAGIVIAAVIFMASVVFLFVVCCLPALRDRLKPASIQPEAVWVGPDGE